MIALYVATPFEYLIGARALRDLVQRTGRYRVISRWLDEDPALATLENLTRRQARRLAERDLDDLRRADGLVLINPPAFARLGTGGRHVECGYALAMGLPIWILGVRSNVYHDAADVRAVVGDPPTLIRQLNQYAF